MKKAVALVDVRMPERGAEALRQYGYNVIKVPAAEYLAAPVSSHPDMLFLPMEDSVFCHGRYLATVSGRSTADSITALTGKTIVTVNDETGAEYPLDVRLNSTVIGDVFLSSRYTAETTVKFAASYGLRTVKVKQGYVKCSSAIVDGETKGIITPDTGIALGAKKEGFKTLVVPAGDISLPGYSYGFIGGCTGYDDGKMFFSGDISLYPHGDSVKEFLHSLECETVSLLPGAPLTDYGSILFL